MTALHNQCPRGSDTASGHAIRQQLISDGFSKAEAVTTLHTLVARGLIERLRVDDPDGQFYTGYRLTKAGLGVI